MCVSKINSCLFFYFLDPSRKNNIVFQLISIMQESCISLKSLLMILYAKDHHCTNIVIITIYIVIEWWWSCTVMCENLIFCWCKTQVVQVWQCIYNIVIHGGQKKLMAISRKYNWCLKAFSKMCVTTYCPYIFCLRFYTVIWPIHKKESSLGLGKRWWCGQHCSVFTLPGMNWL